ncbi:hypothetical protein ACOMHN_049376 [Nucella lapillus]
MIVALVLSLICGSTVAQSSRCVQGENCRLPDCFCPTFQHPFYHDIKDIPQMVYFAFDDALQGQVDRFYRQLFTKDHRNPNGCPISMSLYVQDQWTSYAMVNSYYRRGMEIGSHSVTHTDVNTEQKLLFEAGRQRDNLTRAGHVPREQIQGWRSPNLKAGDVQPDVLKDLGYTYDISLTYTRHKADEPIPWPYTLDFGYPYGCSIRPCPRSTSPHPGFWEVPVTSLYNPESGYPCAYVDSCRPSDEAAAVEYLWSNFEKVYKSNRAPFGLNMHAAWFYNAQYMRTSLTFLRRLLSLPDVYVLNVRQVLAWMKSPVKVQNEVEKFRNHERQSGLNLETDLVHLGYRHPDGTSLVTSRHAGSDDVIPWHYTLDYGWKYCRSTDSQCLFGRYPGLWEVPLVPLVDRTKLTTCTYADGCHSHPASSEDVATFYMDNLKHALDTNRSPMGLHLRYHWFSDPLFYSNLRGLQIFLDAILGSRDDVFVISVEKMLDWMISPLSLDRIAESWKC